MKTKKCLKDIKALIKIQRQPSSLKKTDKLIVITLRKAAFTLSKQQGIHFALKKILPARVEI